MRLWLGFYLVSSEELVIVLNKELTKSETFLEINLSIFGDDSKRSLEVRLAQFEAGEDGNYKI